jgi:hypothetical protein
MERDNLCQIIHRAAEIRPLAHFNNELVRAWRILRRLFLLSVALFYCQIHLDFFCKKAFKRQVTRKEPKTKKKIIFFFVNLAFTWCSPKGESPPTGG